MNEGAVNHKRSAISYYLQAPTGKLMADRRQPQIVRQLNIVS
jgi:hypothetical protein